MREGRSRRAATTSRVYAQPQMHCCNTCETGGRLRTPGTGCATPSCVRTLTGTGNATGAGVGRAPHRGAQPVAPQRIPIHRLWSGCRQPQRGAPAAADAPPWTGRPTARLNLGHLIGPGAPSTLQGNRLTLQKSDPINVEVYKQPHSWPWQPNWAN